MSDDAQLLFLEQANLYRLQEQIDYLVSGARPNGPAFILSEDLLKSLHKTAMRGLLDAPGEYRQVPVIITNAPHKPPGWLDVPPLMSSFCQYLQNEWDRRDLVHLASFVLWRLNWIHPFGNGNGRIARAAAYLTLCKKYGQLLPAKNTVVQQITSNRQPYYEALRAADVLYAQDPNSLDVALQPIIVWMSHLLKEQIKASLG